MQFKYQAQKPSRQELAGMSASEFKTMLRRLGYRVPRDFFKQGAVAQHKNRLYRFRYWAYPEFFVDKSCPVVDFDRWANSVDQTLNFYNWQENAN